MTVRGILFLCLPLSLLLACDADEPCDEGERHVQGACVPDDEAGDAGPSGGSGKGGSSARGGSGGKGGASGQDAATGDPPEKDAGGQGGECSEDREAIMGETCSTDDDCNCAAPYCAKMPGQPMGFCTVFCETEPDDCPDGYMCFDVEKLFGVSGYDPFCAKMASGG